MAQKPWPKLAQGAGKCHWLIKSAIRRRMGSRTKWMEHSWRTSHMERRQAHVCARVSLSIKTGQCSHFPPHIHCFLSFQGLGDCLREFTDRPNIVPILSDEHVRSQIAWLHPSQRCHGLRPSHAARRDISLPGTSWRWMSQTQTASLCLSP